MPQPKRTTEPSAEETRGRPLGKLARDLLNHPGKRYRVPWGTAKPDKTIRDYGYILRTTKDPRGTGYIFWIEER